jgi:hypothetical protein
VPLLAGVTAALVSAGPTGVATAVWYAVERA